MTQANFSNPIERHTAFGLDHGLPLIGTKLVPPRPAGTVLARTRLLEKVSLMQERCMALVCGPAGFGKTTLLGQWRQHLLEQGHSVAWLSLDQQDNTPQTFRRYVLAALSQASGEPLEPVAALTESLALADSRFIRELINLMQPRQNALYLVLDDLHLLNHPGIVSDLEQLLQHAPDCFHLLVGSRSVPALPLSRLQAHNQLLEIDTNALRFNVEETQSYLASANPQRFPATELQRVLSLTEGWITGIQMAALAPSDPLRNLNRMHLGSRQIGRYLYDVVLAPLPVRLQEFLLKTSILGRLTPSLCNAVTEHDDADDMLAEIERHNLFLFSLDSQGHWFRYHALFVETLSERLQHSDIDVGHLHERASNWLAKHQYWAEAIRHALAAGQLGSRSDCAHQGAQSLAEEGDVETLVRWLQQMPEIASQPLDEQRIDLQLNLAWALGHHFHFAASRGLLDSLRPLFNTPQPCSRLTIKYQVIGAITEAFAENISQSIERVEPLLAQVPCGDTWVDGLICNILSYGYMTQGHYPQAQAVQRHMPCPTTPSHNLFVTVYRAFVLGLSHFRQADLHSAEQYYRLALTPTEDLTGPQSSGSATLAALLGEVLYERGEWQALQTLVAPRLSQIDTNAPLDALFGAYASLARRALLMGEPTQARYLLEHAQQLATLRRWPRLQAWLLVEEIRIHLASEQLPQALELQAQFEALDPQRAHAEITRARTEAQCHIAAAQKNWSLAATLWQALLQDDERQGQLLRAVRSRAALACALWPSDQAGAVNTLQPLLNLACRQHLRRSVLDAGDAMPVLLEATVKTARGEVAHYLRGLQENLDPRIGNEDLDSREPSLSERELQILRLIAQGQANKEIARSLDISAETVKWHLKNLFSKLHVTSRIQAITRAQKLSLLG